MGLEMLMRPLLQIRLVFPTIWYFTRSPVSSSSSSTVAPNTTFAAIHGTGVDHLGDGELAFNLLDAAFDEPWRSLAAS